MLLPLIDLTVPICRTVGLSGPCCFSNDWLKGEIPKAMELKATKSARQFVNLLMKFIAFALVEEVNEWCQTLLVYILVGDVGCS
jgi:hypothetical protein